MMTYATAEEVASGFRELTDAEKTRCRSLLEEAAVIIDAYAADGVDDQKKIVSCRMVRRVLGDSGSNSMYPIGSSQGTATALGYSQSWTMTGGTNGELYLSKLEKKLLMCGDRIGARSPLEELCDDYGN